MASPLIWRALYPDASSVLMNDLARDGETDADSRIIKLLRIAAGDKGEKDLFLFALRNPNALVLDHQMCHVIRLAR